jgi:hypothetical protein
VPLLELEVADDDVASLVERADGNLVAAGPDEGRDVEIERLDRLVEDAVGG